MSASVLQQALFYDPTQFNGGTSQTVSLPGPVTAGSTLVLVVVNDDGNLGGVPTTITASDTVNGSWPATLVVIQDTVDNNQMNLLYLPNSLAGSPTVTITWAQSVQSKFGGIVEIGGVTASPLDGSGGQFQPTGPSGTDNITTGAITNTSAPALLFGCSFNKATNIAPSAGTGFTDLGIISPPTWEQNCGRWESKRVITADSSGATFTANDAGQAHMSFGLKLNEAPTGPILKSFRIAPNTRFVPGLKICV